VTVLQTCTEKQERAEQPLCVVKVRELAQQEALERLLLLLDTNQRYDWIERMPAYRWDDMLHRLARLRIAHAIYALETTGEMVRVGPGAWIRRRRWSG